MTDPIEHNDIEKRLKKAAEDFLPAPPGRVWENVRDELHPHRRTYFLAYAAAILLLLAVSVYFLQRQYAHSSRKPSLTQQATPVTLPAQIPSSQTNNNLSNERETNQSGQTGAIAGKTAGENQKESESVRLAAKTFRKSPLHKINREKDEERNNATGGSFHKETVQTPGTKTENQKDEAPGLPHLKNLSAQLNTSSLSSVKVQVESFPLQFAKNISNLSVILPQGKEQFINDKKGKGITEKLHRKPAFEIFYAPSLGYRTLTKGTSAIMTNSSSSALDQFGSSSAVSHLKQQPEWSWSAGARIVFPLGKSWSLQTGLSATEMNYRIAAYGTYPVYIQNNANAASYSYYAMPGRQVSSLGVNAFAAARPQLSYLHNSYITGEIPLLINKQFGNPHSITINLGAGAGLSYFFHSSPVIYSPSPGRYFMDDRYIRPVNANFHVETSVLIPLGSHLKLDFGPSFQYQVLSSYKNYPVIKEHPYLLGLKTGLLWGR
ncbi:MAG: hypothetical protein EPN39_06805 [Chitinophagaceae bacterium]|nr:MAG: hypothetical protein EPN39_06805 [Chitinophagaceae bacterium]